MTKKVTSAAGAAQTGGLSLLGGSGAKDLLLGKNDKGTADKFLDLDPSLKAVTESSRIAQDRGAQQFTKLIDQNANIAANQGAQMEAQVRQNAADQEMRARDMVAQRGLGNSSVGLNAILNQSKGVSDKIGDIRAAMPGMQAENLQRLTGGVNSILGAPGKERTFVQGTDGKGRSGGLLGIGAGIAGMAMSPNDRAGGAQAGMGLGRAFANFS